MVCRLPWLLTRYGLSSFAICGGTYIFTADTEIPAGPIPAKMRAVYAWFSAGATDVSWAGLTPLLRAGPIS